MAIPKYLPFPIGFTNTRTFMQIRTDFPGASGVGAATMLIDYAVSQPEHEFYFADLSFLSRSFDVSLKILEDIVISYDLFRIYENELKQKVCSPFIIQQLEPYYESVRNGKIGGEIASKKRQIKQKEQILELDSKLSQLDSIQGGYVGAGTTPVPYNKSINKSINKEINKTISLELEEEKREGFEEFRKRFKEIHTSEEFYVNGYGLDNVPLILNLDGLIMNSQNLRFLPKKTAFEIWKYLYENRDIILAS